MTGPTQPPAGVELQSSLKIVFLITMSPPRPRPALPQRLSPKSENSLRDSQRTRESIEANDPFGATICTGLQNKIKRLVGKYRQQVWEDHLTSLDAEDGSLWGTARAFRKRPPDFRP
ncbi:hypothetical protein TNCV_1355831 [Trichonephila clavipes]|uniref:Uncharacterized protein n=1 Tax=Trichonephila clavipes TaxID=2585209 RepID=A0A8X6SB83_TRICX|nr:hypothetical protein TNCV_1355831 [Trichonephila clavipes]